jgi:fluoroquinolone resistance protein
MGTIFDSDYFEDEIFQKTILVKGEISNTQFMDCTFISCSFNSSAFIDCRFQNCTFNICDLSLANINRSSFSNTVFRKSKTIGLNWSSAFWSNNSAHILSKPIDFFECTLDYSSFIGLKLGNINIEDCSAIEVDFSEAILTGANFKGSDFRNAIFRNTDLSSANFIGAKNYSISPHGNKINKAKFTMPEAMNLLYSMDISIDNISDE